MPEPRHHLYVLSTSSPRRISGLYIHVHVSLATSSPRRCVGRPEEESEAPPTDDASGPELPLGIHLRGDKRRCVGVLAAPWGWAWLWILRGELRSPARGELVLEVLLLVPRGDAVSILR